ncbi:glycosyltransferase family 4 protein [Haloarcula salinisoli]|uniref:Glycosyltransferase family 4 protein n=1 Tax=Haloarcula salinisoli TaxID=2487746 RepID=A0A8J8CA56_9EURY|nr:glycosyltransferase family 4 protein [Halomicroarcula salinisoli]MBX0288593.1 glycosyltransferase family 4 protein [Halomicroarcula salinisoli]MBX0306027.1 glycosyltransferase family 4 protein [Halomicroarcula salinisoli]
MTVCLSVMEALQGEYDLTLYSTDRPDIDSLNEHYGTDVTDVAVERVTLPTAIPSFVDGKHERAMVNRVAKRQLSGEDVVVSTQWELNAPIPSLQYIDLPSLVSPVPSDLGGLDRIRKRSGNAISKRLAGFDAASFGDARVLTNSNWTANLLRTVHGVEAEVVYPPSVKRDDFQETREWDERESGFVTVGRIRPSKRTLRAMKIVEALRERGLDVHLHVLGPTNAPEYERRARAIAADRPFIKYEGEVSRERLLHLLSTHRYGLHAKDAEPFGIAVAEMVAAGMVPFVPDGGGQREIVDNNAALVYSDISDAVSSIERVLADREKQLSLRETLARKVSDFTRQNYKTAIKQHTAELL